MPKIWIEYTETEETDVCVECGNCTILSENLGPMHTEHYFCDVQCQENENGMCPKFKSLVGG